MAEASFNWEDPLLLDSQLTDEERMVRDAARSYCQDKLAPRVLEGFRHEKTDVKIFPEMGELGLLGATIPVEYGGSGLNYVSYGLIARRLRLPFDDERAVVTCHVTDQRIRQRSAKAKISAQTRPRRMDWLFRSD